MTNADRVRQMSDEKLAMLLRHNCMNAEELCKEKITYECPHLGDGIECSDCWLDWLKQEVEE